MSTTIFTIHIPCNSLWITFGERIDIAKNRKWYKTETEREWQKIDTNKLDSQIYEKRLHFENTTYIVHRVKVTNLDEFLELDAP